ncbi:SusC/RagA family TonB-linked outer membrane protein [Autumnicola psychrophila]|uniref:TonB-dependent receptor n=1 Tax=Autumnicola psychrophila TaxID=3075592 RepID=A0ABU3DU41_9FLAO|nr:TonB-dependent receptor [Zunongwangia sp. F225]MDT0687220.1 TonB-dependent receptor [Zunongwangia sp. F225]
METKRNLKYYFFLIGFLLMLPMNAQEVIEVSGQVTSADDGMPLPGVNVRTRGGSDGTVTDFDGNYTVNANSDATLIFSYLGFETTEVPVNGRTSINVSMAADNEQLSEIVVVGYGTVRKSDLTGAVSSISAGQIQERSSLNVMQSLGGQVAGVQVQQTQGAPGFAPTVKIRGTSTITAGTSPLYVIDGYPMEDFDMSLINPQNIESIEILKDASSAAIYGSKGANGVVMVTTKRGTTGKTQVNVSYEKGVQQVVRKVGMMDAQEYIQYYIDAHNNSWEVAGGNASDPNDVRPPEYRIPPEFLSNPKQFEGSDWQDVLFRDAPMDNVNVSVSGGNENTRVFLSGGFVSQNGIVDRSKFDRYTIRSNVTHDISSAVQVGLNLSFTNIESKEYGTEGKAGAVSLALQSSPIFPVYNENGNLGFIDPNSEWNRFVPYGLQLWHPYALTREIDNKTKRFNSLGSAFVSYNFLENFTFRTNLNASVNNRRYSMYQNAGQRYGYSNINPAVAEDNTSYTYNWLIENTLNYEKTFGDHSLNVLLGYSLQKEEFEESLMTAGEFPNDMVHTLNAGRPNTASSFASEWGMISYIGRVNYSFLNQYLFTGTIRRDGSSRFGADNQWGYFPSASVAWKVSEQDFIRDTPWISSLKVRASYGQTGNNLIPNYGSIGLLGQTQYVYGGNVVQGLYQSTISNPDLKWEKTGQLDIGLNAGLFNNRIYFEADYYNSITRDLLLNQPVPTVTGFTEQLTNIGEVRNRGFEFLLTTRNLVNDFKWDTNFNLTLNRNEVLSLGPNDSPIYINNWGTTKTEVGEPIANYYGYIFDGVFLNQEEIENYPHHPSTRPGDPRVRDVNEDGTIDEDDRTIIGNAQPDFNLGLTNNFSYANFDFSFILQASVGNELLNSQTRYNKWYDGGRNGYSAITDYYVSEENPGDGETFKPYLNYPGLQRQFSDFWVEDGSYLRIANLRLGYTLSESALERTPFNTLRFYANVDNLYVFTDYLGYDPENGILSGALNAGNDYGAYPVPRTITVGMNLGF